jgi:hypothetical protein
MHKGTKVHFRNLESIILIVELKAELASIYKSLVDERGTAQ